MKVLPVIAYGLPFLTTLALWWASTGLILRLDRLDRRTFATTMLGATSILALSLWVTVQSAQETAVFSAYVAFTCGLISWAWQVLSFYTGVVTGPRKSPCPADCRGISRFAAAVQISLYHELTAIAGALLLFALTYDQPNQLALRTYLVFWLMHESAKLNIFFGVPNLGEELLPDHLRYVQSFMKRRAMNAFFPISVTLLTVALTLQVQRVLRPDAPPFETAGDTMLAALIALGLAEHWFLVVPVDVNAIWRSFLPRSDTPRAARAPIETFSSDLALEIEDASAFVERIVTSERLRSTDSWSVLLPKICNAGDVAHVLELIAAGSFGEIEWVRGFARTKVDWVCFELSKGRARMSAFAPQRAYEPLVVARGRQFDRARLRAALDCCAVI